MAYATLGTGWHVTGVSVQIDEPKPRISANSEVMMPPTRDPNLSNAATLHFLLATVALMLTPTTMHSAPTHQGASPVNISMPAAQYRGMQAEITEDPEWPDWTGYHDTEAAYALLRAWSDAFPALTQLYSIGESLQGTPLLVLEITNHATGPAEEKPGYYYDGNIHAGELTGAEVALHFAWKLLTEHGRDPQITELVDTRVLYVRPKFNPDGADVALHTIHGPRSTPRPYDEDGDGLLDEDPPDDLDGDGVATQMRFMDPNGRWRISLTDPRVMVRRDIGDTGPFYDLLTEGVDADGDGFFNEDGVGGIDMNRNFPRNWGLEFEQRGAGPYPLSEPETRATIDFLHAHRNITGIFHGHTSGGFTYRLPSTASWDDFDPADQELILEQSIRYESTTGQRAIPSRTNPKQHRHGTLISWGFWDFGVVGFVPEFWAGRWIDYNGDGTVSEEEQLRFDDEELEGIGFAEWGAIDHPQLGPVEVGGWRRRFVTQNPPRRFLQEEAELYVPWMLWLAEISPRVVITNWEAHTLKDNLLRLSGAVENVGYLPTHITQRALDAQLVQPVRALLELRDAELISGTLRIDLGHLDGTRGRGQSGSRDSRTRVEYVVQVTGEAPQATLVSIAEKGGTDRKRVYLPH